MIAVLHFLLSFYTDRYVFTGPTKETIAYYVFDKMIYLLLLVCIWRFLVLAIKGRKHKTFEYKMLKYCLFLGAIYFVFMLSIYPMIEFTGDMPFFEAAAREYRLNGGLHWISTLVWILGYMMFPCAGGPTIIMGLLSVLAYGYICTKMDEMNISRWCIVLFLLPPIILYSLYPTRITMMTIVYMIYFTILYTDYVKGGWLHNKKLAFLILITGMLSVWRLEGMYLLLFAPLLLILAYRQKFKLKLYLKYFVCILIMNMILSIPMPETKIENKLFPIVGYMLPLMEMNGVNMEACEEYSALNEYVDMELMRYYESAELYRVDYLYSLGVYRADPTISKEDYVWNAVKVCLKHPIEYLQTRLKVFTITADATFFPFTGNNYVNAYGKIESAREIGLYILNGIKSTFLNINDDSAWTILWRTFVGWTKTFTYQLWSSLLIMIWLLIDTLKRKNWFLFCYTLGMWGYSAIAFLFSPATMFKYYWPIYMYCILIIMFYFSKRVKKDVVIEKG